MAKPFQDWKVLPHGKLTQIDDKILTVVGEIRMPLMDLPRRMTVVRLSDGRLVVFSAIDRAEPPRDVARAGELARVARQSARSDRH